jgi:gamma-glutamyltranspeptidase/glutathione hydrolase
MRSLCLSAALLVAACAHGDAAAPTAAPAAVARDDWRLAGQAMVAAADARAVAAAHEMLRRGGGAVDAAIAAHAVLGLVEPQSSGLGGGGYMVVHDRDAGETLVYDGRETAPAGATPDLMMEDGRPIGFLLAMQSGRAVGTPGAVALYHAAHEAHGRLPWAELFEPAIRLAEEGFIVSPRLGAILASPRLKGAPLSSPEGPGAYFFPGGEPLKAGDRRDNPAYAATLRAIAAKGPAAFYSGAIAEGMVAAARAEPRGGALSLEDLAGYEVGVAPALCGPFRAFTICSAPPSSSGGVAMPAILGLYERLRADGPATRESQLADFVIAQQLGYADRDHYVADPAFVTVPAADLIAPAYLDARAAQPFAPGDAPRPGDPGAVLRGAPVVDMWGADASAAPPGTTHLSIVDHEGDAVAFTATIEGPFGSSRWTHGFLLNNEMTDFSFRATVNGKPVANAPAPGKRPRSSMSPTLVFDEGGEVFAVTGSPGGNSIVGYVSKSLVALLDWGMTAQEAADFPNIVARGQTVRVETATPLGKEVAGMLAAQGFKVQEVAGETSGLNLVVAREAGFEGGADPRREGVAAAAALPAR